ncbi:MAG TPA: hypothetical protein VMV46_14640 [Thermoanaerobaculia bacterium]|nr:hypothetical protein [Thermoanaerobaculia bacterium]
MDVRVARAPEPPEPPEAPRALVVVVVGLFVATGVWLLVEVARVPSAWMPPRLLTGAILAAPAVAGAFLRRRGLGWRDAAAAGLLAGALVTLPLAFLGPGLWGSCRPFAVVLQGSLVPALVCVLGAFAGRPALASRGSLARWHRRALEVAAIACGVALLLRGPRTVALGGDGSGWPEAGTRSGLCGAFDLLGHAAVATLWPAPVAAALLASATLLALRWRAGGGAHRGGRPRLAPAIAVLLAAAWLLVEVLLGPPWRGGIGALCGALLLATLGSSIAGAGRAGRPARVAVPAPAPAVVATLVVAQLALGGAQREQPAWLWVHVLFGVALVLPAAMHLGVRAWLAEGPVEGRRLPMWVAAGVALQLVLGVAALLVPPASARLDVLLATLHLGGAVALVAAAAWLLPWRRPRSSGQGEPGAAGPRSAG